MVRINTWHCMGDYIMATLYGSKLQIQEALVEATTSYLKMISYPGKRKNKLQFLVRLLTLKGLVLVICICAHYFNSQSQQFIQQILTNNKQKWSEFSNLSKGSSKQSLKYVTSFNKVWFPSTHITIATASLHSKPDWLQVPILCSIMTLLYSHVKLPKTQNIDYNSTVNVHLFTMDNDASIILSYLSYMKPMPFISCSINYLSTITFTTSWKKSFSLSNPFHTTYVPHAL